MFSVQILADVICCIWCNLQFESMKKSSCHIDIKGNLSSIIFVLYPPPEEVGHCSLSPDCVKLKTSSACRQRVVIHIPSNSFHFNFSPDVVSRWHNTNDFYAKKSLLFARHKIIADCLSSVECWNWSSGRLIERRPPTCFRWSADQVETRSDVSW